MSKLWKYDADKAVAFRCPGCGGVHVCFVNGHRNTIGATWDWNGSTDSPTFQPSIFRTEGIRCHSFVRNGTIEFLADSNHALAGKTVILPEVDYERD